MDIYIHECSNSIRASEKIVDIVCGGNSELEKNQLNLEKTLYVLYFGISGDLIWC